MILTEVLACFTPNIWLHQYTRRAAVYGVNKVKRIADPRLGTPIGLA